MQAEELAEGKAGCVTLVNLRIMVDVIICANHSRFVCVDCDSGGISV